MKLFEKNENCDSFERKMSDYLGERDKKDLLDGLNSILDFVTDPDLVKLRGGIDYPEMYGINALINQIRILQE